MRAKIDTDQAHRALFFNMIVGRDRLIRSNSIIGKKGYLWEISNGRLFGKWSNIHFHWQIQYGDFSQLKFRRKFLITYYN